MRDKHSEVPLGLCTHHKCPFLEQDGNPLAIEHLWYSLRRGGPCLLYSQTSRGLPLKATKDRCPFLCKIPPGSCLNRVLMCKMIHEPVMSMMVGIVRIRRRGWRMVCLPVLCPQCIYLGLAVLSSGSLEGYNSLKLLNQNCLISSNIIFALPCSIVVMGEWKQDSIASLSIVDLSLGIEAIVVGAGRSALAWDLDS